MSMAIRTEAEAKYPMNRDSGNFDPKAWAKRFVYRHQHGDRDLLYVQVLFAYQALGLEVPKQS